LNVADASLFFAIFETGSQARGEFQACFCENQLFVIQAFKSLSSAFINTRLKWGGVLKGSMEQSGNTQQ